MLFGYERLRAFPIDVWIERVLKERYFPRARKLTARVCARSAIATSANTAGTRSNTCFTTPARRRHDSASLIA
jgi:hypothetical protein